MTQAVIVHGPHAHRQGVPRRIQQHAVAGARRPRSATPSSAPAPGGDEDVSWAPRQQARGNVAARPRCARACPPPSPACRRPPVRLRPGDRDGREADRTTACASPGGGAESISLVQNDKANNFRAKDPWLVENLPELYLPMLHTAEVVAERYGVSREAQDEYALSSQQRTAAAQEAGRFDQEIVPLTSTKIVVDKETGESSEVEVTLEKDEGNRPSTTLESLQGLNPVLDPGVASKVPTITAGNASQLSDGARLGLMSARRRRSGDRSRWAFPRASPCRQCS